MDKREIDKRLDETVPVSTRLKDNIRNLWAGLDDDDPVLPELEECIELSRKLEGKLRGVARSLQSRQ